MQKRASRSWAETFHHFAVRCAEVVGSPVAFLGCVLIILTWAVTGPISHFSDTWQLIINTATTIVTFLMVFLIQNTQNRDARALHLKLDELIRCVQGARNGMINLEKLTEQELDELEQQFRAVQRRARKVRDLAS
jgi:low affinity Fe/Cu permease